MVLLCFLAFRHLAWGKFTFNIFLDFGKFGLGFKVERNIVFWEWPAVLNFLS